MRMTTNITAMTAAMATYGVTRTERSESFTRLNSASSSSMRSELSRGSSLACMKFMATNMPRIEPQGLKHWAIFRRLVAVASEPIDRM